MNVAIQEKMNVRVYKEVCVFIKKNTNMRRNKSELSRASEDILNGSISYLGLGVRLRT